MPNIIDPVTEPSVLREPSFCMDELDFDALSSPLLQLQGKVDKSPRRRPSFWPVAQGSASAKKVASSWWRLPASPSLRGRPRPSTR